MLDSHVDRLICPDCRSPLRFVRGSDELSALACGSCSLVFPVEDGIPILLPRHARNAELELPLLERLAADDRCEGLSEVLEKTRVHLASQRGSSSWEWEDEAFWREKYKRQTERLLAGEKLDEGRWGVRFWQREYLIERLPASLWTPEKTILDIGCGAGHNFRVLLCDRFDPSSLYIAADISLNALKLNRLRNPHENALYVLCSADRLPIRDSTVDLLCYFGILHHTERKSDTIEEDARLLVPGGRVLLHEALTRKSARPSFMPVHDPGSEHEETIDPAALQATIDHAQDLRVVAERSSHTLVMGVCKMILRRFARSRTAYEVVALLDGLAYRLLGRFSAYFAPAEVLMLLEKVAGPGIASEGRVSAASDSASA